ncbi:helix-turn-helix transcriptional regulator [Halorussus marinus]|uniref:helix-turn-helix transcriptional regulator n=1 Tax=Halorussus marinus TaxID=2505976 RepID=UPI0010930862
MTAVCPDCGTPISAIVTRGPSAHFLAPCGCRATTRTVRDLAGDADRGRGVATDGGLDVQLAFADFHAFERDLLYAVRALERDGDQEPPKGLAIKSYLEDDYDEINHSRLYQNLDALIERGLLSKAEKDGRTNEYATTDRARQLLTRHAQRRADQAGLTGVDRP